MQVRLQHNVTILRIEYQENETLRSVQHWPCVDFPQDLRLIQSSSHPSPFSQLPLEIKVRIDEPIHLQREWPLHPRARKHAGRCPIGQPLQIFPGMRDGWCYRSISLPTSPALSLPSLVDSALAFDFNKHFFVSTGEELASSEPAQHI